MLSLALHDRGPAAGRLNFKSSEVVEEDQGCGSGFVHLRDEQIDILVRERGLPECTA